MSRDLERLSGLVLSVFCAVAPCADVEADEGFAVASTPLVRVDAANAATFTSGVWRAAAWRNERVHAPFVIRGKAGAAGFTASVEPDTERDAKVFSAASVQIRWVRETLASANYRYPWVWVDVPEHKVGDILDPSQPFALTDRAFRALWVTVKTPSDAEPGRYRASLAVRNAAGAEVRCRMEIEVLPVSLPARRKMYLDIWQTPWTIARYYGVKPFSPEHYARMEPIFRELAAAGQKAITATITDYPWNVRKNIDTARSMVRYVKRRDGSFVADFTTLDEYVDFAKRCGIGPQIHCYALVKFQKHRDYWYHDEATGEEAHVDCDPGTPEYEAYWGPLLRQLEAHAKEKGWTGDIYAALDELPPHETSLTAKLVKKYAPSLKFQMAGDVNPADFGDVRIDNYSQALRFDYISREFLAETARRKARGLITTYYICCVPERPNSFLTSPLAEQRWLGLFAAAKGFDGFLKSTSHRWMMDRDPLVDASCKPGWAPGECFLIYPGPLLSLRWEMMVDGFEEFDKVAILRESGRMTPRVRNVLKWVDYQRLLEGKTSDLERIVENAVHEIETASRLPASRPAADAQNAQVELFNGRDLTNWYTFIRGRGVNCDPKGVFTVTNGILHVSGEEFGCLATLEEYSDYRLTVEYRWTGKPNVGNKKTKAPDSGILFHSTGPDGGFYGTWMYSHEYNLILGASGDLWTVGGKNRPDMFVEGEADDVLLGGRYFIHKPGGRMVRLTGNDRLCRSDIARDWTDTFGVRPASNERPVGEWNTAELVCKGDSAVFLFNGLVVNRIARLAPARGKIQLQSEGCPIQFRRVALQHIGE